MIQELYNNLGACNTEWSLSVMVVFFRLVPLQMQTWVETGYSDCAGVFRVADSELVPVLCQTLLPICRSQTRK